MSYFPLFLDIGNINFLIVGAGNVALAKLESVLEFTDKVTVVASEISYENEILLKERNIKHIKTPYKEKHLEGQQVIIAATNDKEVNKGIANDAKKQSKLVNIVDDPENSKFIFGANIKRNNLIISVGTSGLSPVLSRILKYKINASLPQNLSLIDEFIAFNKNEVKTKLSNLQARRLFWQDTLEGSIGQEISSGNLQKAQSLFKDKLSHTKNIKQSTVYFIGAGPGDPELITLKAINLLSKADVVLYDRLVSPEILNYARKDALRINVGKSKGSHCFDQNQINQLIKKYAKENNIVARLKGGDPSIFGNLSSELEAIKDLNIHYQIIPGITAASAAAAYSGIPLTSRDHNTSVKFLTFYKKDLFNDAYWQELAKTRDSLVFYMSSHNLNIITSNLAKFGKNTKTPLVIIEQATTIYQKTYISDIENFSKDFTNKEFSSPSLVIIGDVALYHKSFNWKEQGKDGTYFPAIKPKEIN